MPICQKNQVSSPKVDSVRSLRSYDNQTFAVFLKVGLASRPFRGKACYQRDDLLGNILRIHVSGELFGKPDIIIVEDEWNGLITDGREHGCDHSLMLVPKGW